jgi:glucose dehydrogenase
LSNEPGIEPDDGNEKIRLPKLTTTTPLGALGFFFGLGGVLLIILGLVHLYGLMTQGYTVTRMGDMAVNILSGLLYLICAVLIARKNPAAIWLFTFTIGVSLYYSFWAGRGFNYLSLILGVFILLQLYKFMKMGKQR